MRNDYFIDGEVAYIYSTRNGERHTILVDSEDIDRLLEHNRTWCVAPNNSGNRNGSLYAKHNDPSQYLHRLIVNAPKGIEVDHINQNTLDNRKCNLRLVTSAENKQNRSTIPRHNTSGVRGVKWSKRSKKWHAKVILNKKEYHIGYFDDIKEAELAITSFRADYVRLSPENTTGDVRDLSELNDSLRSDNTSGVKGVTWDKARNKWKVMLGGKNIGRFSTFDEAKQATENYFKEG